MNILSPPLPGILSELRGLDERYHTLYMCMYTCMSHSLRIYMYVPRKRQVSDVRFHPWGMGGCHHLEQTLHHSLEYCLN